MNETTYFGFGIAPNMFPANCTIIRRSLSVEEVCNAITAGVTPCLNPSHALTIAAMRERFGIIVQIPEKAPTVALVKGDSVIVMGVSGLPRLEGRHEYTPEEVAGAGFTFSVFSVTA